MTFRPLWFCPHRAAESSPTVLFSSAATIPVFSIIYTTSRATDHKSPCLKSSLTSTHASRSFLTACHCYSIVHYIKKSEISLVILSCTRKQEQLINLRRQSHPLNIKHHPSPGTTLMRRKWHESSGHASLERLVFSVVVQVGVCAEQRCFHIYNPTKRERGKNVEF